MRQSDSLLINYIKRKLQLEVETSSFLEFIYQYQDFFGVKSMLWKETGCIYIYSIVFSICNNKETDLFFQLIERELQRKKLVEIITLLKAFELSTNKLEKINNQPKTQSNSVALDVSFQVSILVKVLENKLEIMLVNFLEKIVAKKLKEVFVEKIMSDININATQEKASDAMLFLETNFK